MDFPIELRWWRRSDEAAVRRRNPLMELEGFSTQNFCVDALHTLFLGPARDWLAACFWLLIEERAIASGRDQAETAALTMLQIRHRLTAWYSRYEKAHPREQVTRVDNLEATMLGQKSSPQLATKAAETKGLIPFGVELMQATSGQLSSAARPLLRIGEAMTEMVCAMRDSPRVLSAAESQRLHDAFNKLARHWALSGLPTKPKMHLLCHMVGNADYHGIPGMHTTFADEGLNRVLAQMGRVAHRNVWELRIFAHFQKHQALEPKRKSQRCG